MTMALCSCEFCGKPFNSIGSKLCPECLKKTDEYYLQVRKFIYQNPEQATFTSIVEQTEVPEQVLNYLISQGRVVLEDYSGSGTMRCRACGQITNGGSLCDRCRKKLMLEHLMPQEKNVPTKTNGKNTKPLSYSQKD